MTQGALFPAGDTPAPRMPHPDGVGYMPAWIADQIQADTHTARRTAQYQTCPKCQEITLTGLDHDTAAFTAIVDPTPLTPTTELACIIQARRTYTAWRTTNGYQLELRDHVTMSDLTHPVLPRHQCGQRFPGFLEPPTEGHHHGWNEHPQF